MASFWWRRTAQGYDFWEDQYDNGLTDDGRAIIQAWINELEHK